LNSGTDVSSGGSLGYRPSAGLLVAGLVRLHKPLLRIIDRVGVEHRDLTRYEPTKGLDTVLQPVGVGDDSDFSSSPWECQESGRARARRLPSCMA